MSSRKRCLILGKTDTHPHEDSMALKRILAEQLCTLRVEVVQGSTEGLLPPEVSRTFLGALHPLAHEVLGPRLQIFVQVLGEDLSRVHSFLSSLLSPVSTGAALVFSTLTCTEYSTASLLFKITYLYV